jgi:two-component system CheB/CheR fusion protein
VVIDRAGALVLANAKARSMFGLDTRDLGRPLQDLELSYRPVELRSLIEQAYAEGHPVLRTGIQRLTPNGEAQQLDLQVVPLIDNGNQLLGINIIFEDVTHFHQL